MMSRQQGAADLAGVAGTGPGTLASDVDRDAVAGMLREAFAEGRLTAGEHGERVQAVYAARTWEELARLTTDLPGAVGASARYPAQPPVSVDRCLRCLLLVLCPPAGIAWLLSARRCSCPGRARPLESARGERDGRAEDR